MFIDLAKVKVKAGKGGDGVVAWRREIYVDKGGPSGGDGGKGGDIVFVGDVQLNTLHSFRFNQAIVAEEGFNGAKQRRHGRSGQDKLIRVPVGTVIKNGDLVVADIIKDGQRVIGAHGGDGGFGNAHFKSSTRQAPKVAELGEKGEELELSLELKLLADVGLVGLPNAGKSTFLSVSTNARPKIADYPFTTLEPNLGVHDIGSDSILIADIPGLIEGASEGKGLGYDFLRHIERTAVLVHLVDVNSVDVTVDYQTITDELKNYSIDISSKDLFVVLNKIDTVNEGITKAALKALKKTSGQKVYAISSVKSQGINELMKDVLVKVKQYRQAEQEIVEDSEDYIPVLTINMEDAWKVQQVSKNNYQVTGPKIEKFARRTDLENEYSVQRLKDIMQKMGILHELSRQGAKIDDIISIDEKQIYL